MTTKRCAHCRQVKAIDCFNRAKATADGFQGVCRACTRAMQEAGKLAKRL